MRAEGKSGQFGDLVGGTLGEFRMRVEACADGRSTDRQLEESIENLFEALAVAIEQAGPAAKLLTDGQRYCILQMGAADLYDGIELLGLCGDSVAHSLDRRNQRIPYAFGGGDVHGRRESV